MKTYTLSLSDDNNTLHWDFTTEDIDDEALDLTIAEQVRDMINSLDDKNEIPEHDCHMGPEDGCTCIKYYK